MIRKGDRVQITRPGHALFGKIFRVDSVTPKGCKEMYPADDVDTFSFYAQPVMGKGAQKIGMPTSWAGLVPDESNQNEMRF